MIAHLILRDGRWSWSGYNASGDPAHRPHALVADVGRDFLITGEGNLYLTGPGPLRFTEWSPEAVVLAARGGMFGFRVLHDDETGSRRRDAEEQRRRKLGRRGRIAEDQERSP
jgi:hypothetical protein